MNQATRRTTLLSGLAASAMLCAPEPTAAQITISRQFRAGRAVALASPRDIASTPNLLQADNRAALQRGAVVHIPAFRLEMAKRVQRSAQTRGRGARQQSTFLLEGVDDAALQAMTQALYETFVRSLTAAGYSVASIEETRSHPNLARFFNDRPSPVTGPAPDGESTFYAPAGISVNTVAGDTRLPSGMGAFSAMGGITNLATGAATAAQSGVIVLMPRYALTFVDVDASSDHFLGGLGGSASVTGRAGLRILPEATRVEAYVPTTGGARFYQDWFALSSPLELAGIDLGPMHDATTNGQRRNQAAGMAVGALLALGGLGGAGSSGANTNALSAGPRLRETLEPYLISLQTEFLRGLNPAS